MRSIQPPRPARQRGLTLIELMVGMVIAMIAVIIMMQVLLTADERTRTTSAGNDALSSGAIMMHMIQRDLVQAGYGINTTKLFGCQLALPTGPTVPIAPVVINPDNALLPVGDPGTDTLLVFYGNGAGQPEGNEVFGKDAGTNTYTVQAGPSFGEGDKVIGSADPCAGTVTLAEVTGQDGSQVTVNSFNNAAVAVYNLGRAPRIVGYAIRNGALTSCDYMAVDCRVNDALKWTAVAGGIVGLRAQYGRDASGGTPVIIDTWDQTTPPGACEQARTSAVRFALVARSGQFETRIDDVTKQRVCDEVTAAPPSWQGTADGAPIDLSKNPDGSENEEWQCYRYRTFETIAPSRNIVWMQGC